MRLNRSKLAIGFGLFYAVSDFWPVVHLRSFAAVTGPKPEGWLVKTVGLCLANLGVATAVAGARGRVPDELRGVAVGTALSLAAIDLYYAGARRRISPVYLADGVVQLALAAAWAVSEDRPGMHAEPAVA